jgi:hypothetical protein
MNHPFTTSQSLSPLLASDFLLSTLATRDGRRSTAQLVGDVKSYLAKEQAFDAFQALVKEGYAADDSGRVILTKLGANTAKVRFGHLPSGHDGRRQLERVIWPARVLGMDPTSKGARRLASGQNLRAAALTVILGLPLDKGTVTLNTAVSALLVRGLSGTSTLSQSDGIFKTLVRSIGDLSSPNALRKALTVAGLALSTRPLPDVNRDDEDDLTTFAQRVQAVTDTLSTPPFSRKVAISQIYDAYGRKHPDAGRLEAFKERLLKANISGNLDLCPLDEPEALDSDVRARSVIETRQGRRYHFVARSSR